MNAEFFHQGVLFLFYGFVVGGFLGLIAVATGPS